MAAVLDVWVAKPGAACLVDDEEWLVTVYDAHGNVFEWAGSTYQNLPAPHAHWAGTIPPGCYVVQAINAKTGAHTDHAIVTVGCDGLACVHLFVPKEGGPQRCKITIKEVVGIGEQVADSIHVTGTAAGCNKVEVSVTCSTGKPHTVVVNVGANGLWTADIDARNLRCICGKPVSVIARCAEHPECADELEEHKLHCRPRSEDDRG